MLACKNSGMYKMIQEYDRLADLLANGRDLGT